MHFWGYAEKKSRQAPQNFSAILDFFAQSVKNASKSGLEHSSAISTAAHPCLLPFSCVLQNCVSCLLRTFAADAAKIICRIDPFVSRKRIKRQLRHRAAKPSVGLRNAPQIRKVFASCLLHQNFKQHHQTPPKNIFPFTAGELLSLPCSFY